MEFYLCENTYFHPIILHVFPILSGQAIKKPESLEVTPVLEL